MTRVRRCPESWDQLVYQPSADLLPSMFGRHGRHELAMRACAGNLHRWTPGWFSRTLAVEIANSDRC
jgi:hypothetical protein